MFPRKKKPEAKDEVKKVQKKKANTQGGTLGRAKKQANTLGRTKKLAGTLGRTKKQANTLGRTKKATTTAKQPQKETVIKTVKRKQGPYYDDTTKIPKSIKLNLGLKPAIPCKIGQINPANQSDYHKHKMGLLPNSKIPIFQRAMIIRRAPKPKRLTSILTSGRKIKSAETRRVTFGATTSAEETDDDDEPSTSQYKFDQLFGTKEKARRSFPEKSTHKCVGVKRQCTYDEALSAQMASQLKTMQRNCTLIHSGSRSSSLNNINQKQTVNEEFLNRTKYKTYKKSQGKGVESKPVGKERAATNRGLTQTAMPFWGYLQPMVPGYKPLHLDKVVKTGESKYTFGTSKKADYNMKNEYLEKDEEMRKKFKFSMFSITRVPQKDGFYNIFVTGNDIYLDRRRVGPSKRPIKEIHYISLAKNSRPIFRIVVSPPHDYKLPKDTAIEVRHCAPQFGMKEHFLNMYMVEKELPMGKFGDDKLTYLAFSYREMDACILQIIKCEGKKSPTFPPNCTLRQRSDCEDQLLPPDYVLLQKEQQSNYIVKLCEFSQMPRHLFISFERMYGGDLRKRIAKKGKLTQTQAKVFFNQLLGALQYLHRRTIVHGDITLEHLLLDNNDEYCRLKLCNFSHAFNGKKKFHQVEGNVAYKPPEALEGRSDFVLDNTADIWSFGVCLYESISGIHPFTQGSMDEAILINRICDGDYNFHLSLWLDIDQSCKDLIMMTLQNSPDDRPCTATLCEDDWMSGAAARRIRARIRDEGMDSYNM